MGIIHRFNSIEDGEFRWQDVPVSAYGPENSRADRATRQILIGIGETSPHFHMRYFVVQLAGYTSLGQHTDDHGVYLLLVKTRLRLATEVHELQWVVVVFISVN